MTTFFARLDPKYLKVPENAMIELEMMPFLKATKAILPFFGKWTRLYNLL